MLTLISLGLYDERDLSLRAIEAAKACDTLYCEFYTDGVHTTAEKISRLIGKPVRELQRSAAEEQSAALIKEAKAGNVGLFVGGDALSATTHISLLLEARKHNIRTRVIHGSSVFTAVAETGLQLYSFGRTTTLAFPEEHYNPTSPYDVIAENRARGLHTLVLLDTRPGRQMDAPTGIRTLLDMEQRKRKKQFTEETKIVAACRLGGEEALHYGPARELVGSKKLAGKTPAVLVVPGKLHFLEEEFLALL
jgi:diphthine synthase